MDLERSQTQQLARLQRLLSILNRDLAGMIFIALVLSEDGDEFFLQLRDARLHELAARDLVPDVVEHARKLHVVDLIAARKSDQ